jgi:hypothetical protein
MFKAKHLVHFGIGIATLTTGVDVNFKILLAEQRG